MARLIFSKSARVAAVGAVTLALFVSSGGPAGAATTGNLLKNGTAEAGPGGTGDRVNVPGWKRTTGTQFTAVKYGTTDFPKTSDLSAANPGKNFFAGGGFEPDFPTQVVTQTISLAPYVNKVKAGAVKTTVAGWFGGYISERDNAGIEIDFKDAMGGFVGSGFQVGFVTAGQRHNNTSLLHRLSTKAVPKGARSIYVQFIFNRVEGAYNDSFADNVTLTLAGV